MKEIELRSVVMAISCQEGEPWPMQSWTDFLQLLRNKIVLTQARFLAVMDASTIASCTALDDEGAAVLAPPKKTVVPSKFLSKLKIEM